MGASKLTVSTSLQNNLKKLKGNNVAFADVPFQSQFKHFGIRFLGMSKLDFVAFPVQHTGTMMRKGTGAKAPINFLA